jgi:hypothetical protein
VSVLPHILHLLGDLDEIRFTAGRFFEHVHQWMPFISKKRFYDMYLQPAFQTRPDVVLLLLALKLITTFPPAGARGPRTPLYDAVRRLYVEVEGAFSILVLQAGVLVALYELGHGIYPAAYLSIGACARYAHALGINVSRTVPTRRVLTLVEVEERRRVWWAIVILDRYVARLHGYCLYCRLMAESFIASSASAVQDDPSPQPIHVWTIFYQRMMQHGTRG